MGAVCSHSVVTLNEHRSTSSSSNGPSITQTTTTKTIQSPNVWNPFQITKNEAEDLLQSSDPGSFVFSHDMTSELFLSLCVGKYVCHHSVVTRENAFHVGARTFETIGDVIEYFTEHPLGEMTLKEEFKMPQQTPPVIQVKQHPDITIPTTMTPTTSEVNSSDSDLKKNTLIPVHQAFKEKSPVLRRPTNYRTPVDRIEEESRNFDENEADIETKKTLRNKISSTLSIPNNKVAPLPKKPLIRSAAVDRVESSSSGGDRELPSSVSLVPIIPQADIATTSTQLYS